MSYPSYLHSPEWTNKITLNNKTPSILPTPFPVFHNKFPFKYNRLYENNLARNAMLVPIEIGDSVVQ